MISKREREDVAKSLKRSWVLVVYAFSSSSQGGRGRQISVSLRPAWSTKRVPGQPGVRKAEGVYCYAGGRDGRGSEFATESCT